MRNSSFFHSRVFRSSLLLAALTLSYLGWQMYQIRSGIQSQLDVLRAKNLPINYSDLNDYYSIPAGTVDSTSALLEALDQIRAADLQTTGEHLPFIGLNFDPIPMPGETWDQLEEAREFLRTMRAVKESIRVVGQQGGQIRLPVDLKNGFDTFQDLMDVRSMMRLMLLDAHVCLHDGHTGMVKDDLLIMLKFSEATRGEASLAAQRTRSAIQTSAIWTVVEQLVPHGEWTDDDLLEIQHAIRRIDNRTAYTHALTGERVRTVEGTQRQLRFMWRDSNVHKILVASNTLQDSLKNSWHDGVTAAEKFRTKAQALENSRLTKFRYGNVIQFSRILLLLVQSGAMDDVCRLSGDSIIAINRFHIKNGRLPESLCDLVPDFLPNVPIDPFDGQPMRYRKSKTSVTVYSVYVDRIDDGGPSEPQDVPQQDYGMTFTVPEVGE